MKVRPFCAGFLIWLWLALPPALAEFNADHDAPNSLLAQLPERLMDLAKTGIHRNYLLDFKGSAESFQTMIQEFPEHPSGYVCMAGLLESRMILEQHNKFEGEMFRLLDRCVALSKEEVKKGRVASARFFIGGALGYSGLHHVRKKDWWKALKDGIDAEDVLTKLVKMDPNVFDAYYGLGLYDYYRSRYSRTVHFLPFFSDKREQGIQELKLCMERGLFTAAASRVSLMWVYFEEGRMAEAEALADWMIENYPPYPDSWRLKAAIREKEKNPAGQIEALRQNLSLIEQYVPNDHLDRISLRVQMADLYDDLGQPDEAKPLYQAVRDWPPVVDHENAQEINALRKKATTRLEKMAKAR